MMKLRIALLGEEPELEIIARELGVLGHQPLLFSSCQPSKPWDYLSWGNLVPHDALVASPRYEVLTRRSLGESRIKLAFGHAFNGATALVTSALGIVSATKELIPKLSEDAELLGQHFWRRNDIVALMALVDQRGGYMSRDWSARIQEHYGWANDPVAYAEHYKKLSAGHQGNYEDHSGEARFIEVLHWLERLNIPQGGTVLDFACSYGWYTIELAKRLPHLEFIGMDIDPASLEYARGYAAKAGVSNTSFVVGRETDLKAEQYNAVIAAEVLEHVPSPASSLTRIASAARIGGEILITVPYGPWEQLSHDSFPYRAHIWDFDHHDIDDLLQGVENEIRVEPAGRNWMTGEAMGWHIAKIKRAQEMTFGGINMARKLTFQSPI